MTPFALWKTHQDLCERCQLVEPDKGATLANACLSGARLVKDAIAAGNADKKKNRERREARP